MAVRIPVSPDPQGVIRLSCGGQDLEIIVTGWHGNAGDAPQNAPEPDFKPRAVKDVWNPINPIDEPSVFMRIDDVSDMGIGSLIDQLGGDFANERQVTFVADKSVNFHQLCELGESLQQSDIAGFAVAFRPLDRDEL
jgi:hypothetical protein